ncbi:MAG: type IV pili methyl-accepting chemotaxis transducer N-terminal domain-containing protein [Arcobacteraceae bacterium]|jgi:nitrate/nitrite-specific signal transduction histidine kinase|nr:type IV pili methyl-accepting chemotaxis transducer N-terminal domain-containing protein [Arcobacteraceae bacterium]
MSHISVSQKIKIIGSFLLLTVFIVISVTIYLNQKNKKDALTVNMAGKQRMLTQKITKNIFQLYQTKSHNFTEIDEAVREFESSLKILQYGDENLNISPVPNDEIQKNIEKVTILWVEFSKNIAIFKNALVQTDTAKLDEALVYFEKSNNILLNEVDKIVTLYTNHIETKNAFIKNFQYVSFAFLLIFAIYSIVQLKQIEEHAKDFIKKSKQMSQANFENISPLDVDSEKEFVEIADNLNCFINKVSSAMNYSQNALEQSKLASEKLENLTDEFSVIIKELENRSDVVKQIDKSEDIVIESTEELLKTTKKLQLLKKELDMLLLNCKQK